MKNTTNLTAELKKSYRYGVRMYGVWHLFEDRTHAFRYIARRLEEKSLGEVEKQRIIQASFDFGGGRRYSDTDANDKNFSEIYEFLLNDKTLKKYVCDSAWVSGSSTKVYPVEKYRNGIVIQLKGNRSSLNARLFDGAIDRLIKSRFGKMFVRKQCFFWKSDGSCPSTLTLTLRK